MKEYTKKELKELNENPYTLKATKNKISHTAEFKRVFWTKYQAGESPRKILTDLGYNPKIMEVNVSNGRVLDRGVLMISENPIAIITAKKR